MSCADCGALDINGARVTGKRFRVFHRAREVASSVTTFRQAREHVQREMIEQALKRNFGRVTSAATDLGISRPTLYELMGSLGLSKERLNSNTH